MGNVDYVEPPTKKELVRRAIMVLPLAEGVTEEQINSCVDEIEKVFEPCCPDIGEETVPAGQVIPPTEGE